MWTFSLNHIVRRMLYKSCRQLYFWHFYTIKTISLLALFAIEMRMQVVVMVVVVAVAEFIAGTIATTLYGMHKVVFTEESERTEDIGFIDGINLYFQLGHRLGLDRRNQGL